MPVRSSPSGPEEVVGHGDDPAPVDHDLATTLQPVGVIRPGPVEGHRDRCPPVDDDGVPAPVLDVAPTDVPGAIALLVDASEEQRARALGQNGDAVDQRRLVVEVGIPGAPHVPEQALGPMAHLGQGQVGPVEVVLFGEELGVLVPGRAGHGSSPPAAPARTATPGAERAND